MGRDVEQTAEFINHLNSTLENMKANNAHRARRNSPERQNYEALNQLYQESLAFHRSLNEAEASYSRNNQTPDRIIRDMSSSYERFNNQFRIFRQAHPNLLQQVYTDTQIPNYNFGEIWDNMSCDYGAEVLTRMNQPGDPFIQIKEEEKDFSGPGATAQMIGSYLSLEGERQEYENITGFINSLDEKSEDLNNQLADLQKQKKDAQDRNQPLSEKETEEIDDAEQKIRTHLWQLSGLRTAAYEFRQSCIDAGDLYDAGELDSINAKITEAETAAGKLEEAIQKYREDYPDDLNQLTNEEGKKFLQQWDSRIYEGGTFDKALSEKRTGRPNGYSDWPGFINFNINQNYHDDELDLARTTLSRTMIGKMKQNSGEALTYESMEDLEKKAEVLRNDPIFLKMTENTAAVNHYLENPAALSEAVTKYGAERSAFTTGINAQLSWLGKTMDPNLNGRSTDWQNLHRAINNPQFNSNSKQSVDTVINAIDTYTKGKEGLRRSVEKGRYSFNQAMDALAVVSQTSTHAKARADRIVERINAVRRKKGQPLVSLEKHLQRVESAAAAKNYQQNPDYRQQVTETAKTYLKNMSYIVDLKDYRDNSSWYNVVKSLKNPQAGQFGDRQIRQLYDNAKAYSLGQYFNTADGKMSLLKNPQVDETKLLESMDILSVISKISPEYKGETDRLVQKINLAREKQNMAPIDLDEHGAARMREDYENAEYHYLDEDAEKNILHRSDTDSFIEENENQSMNKSRTSSFYNNGSRNNSQASMSSEW